MSEAKEIAERYDVPVELVQKLAASGLERELSYEAALVGIRLSFSMEYGGNELFGLKDVAAVIGGTIEDAKKLMIDGNCNPVIVSPAPGFEWLFGENTQGGLL